MFIGCDVFFLNMSLTFLTTRTKHANVGSDVFLVNNGVEEVIGKLTTLS